MGMREDELLVPRRAIVEDTALMQSRDFDTRQRFSVRKFLMPLMLALGIFGVSAGAARYLFPRKKIQRQQQLQQVVGPGVRGKTGASPGSLLTSYCATESEPVMEGADLTSYFSLKAGSAAVFGVAEHESVYNGYRFWFASEENKAQFEEEPLAYMPEWGGFCGYGISAEDWWTKDTLGPDADPNQWLMTDDGKLYFFRSELPMTLFLEDVEGNKITGDALWESWWGDASPSVLYATGEGSPLDTNCFCSVETCDDA